MPRYRSATALKGGRWRGGRRATGFHHRQTGAALPRYERRGGTGLPLAAGQGYSQREQG
ncbi:hypothetical protein [Streptomyces malaysiensis]|uniref:hypothetical protein n=1 Tax=Streptomyces malaysiensis TaxID=92644 RepID=UPI00142ECCC0|nr:hypothetical protein [Streptomyces malaysiensis]